jgi:hypothetical protein
MTRRSRSTLSLATCAALLAACAIQTGNTSPSPDPSRPALSAPALTTIPPSDEPVTGEVPADILANIIADAAREAGTGEGEIEIVRAEAVTWNDGSLGCPEPGMVYTQALVEGYHVVLEAGGERLDYRVGSGGSFRLCESGRPGG